MAHRDASSLWMYVNAHFPRLREPLKNWLARISGSSYSRMPYLRVSARSPVTVNSVLRMLRHGILQLG